MCARRVADEDDRFVPQEIEKQLPRRWCVLRDSRMRIPRRPIIVMLPPAGEEAGAAEAGA